MKYGKAEGGMMKKMGRGMAKADMQEKAMKKGGKTHSDASKDKPMMKKVASAAVKGHESRMHKKGGTTKMAKGGCATKKMAKGGSYRSSCDGIAKRGKTRAK